MLRLGKEVPLSRLKRDIRNALGDISTTPALDARLLLCCALECSFEALLLEEDRTLTAVEHMRLQKSVARRLAREPVAYILKRKEFYGLPFYVDRRVLTPRPETELIIDRVRARLAEDAKVTFLDLGVGSGCICITLLHYFRHARALGVDSSAAALDVARRNARTHAVDKRLELLCSNWDSRIAQGRRFDVITANPPYLSEQEWQQSEPEVRVYEPRQALVATHKGLSAITNVVRVAKERLVPGGFALIEHGAGQDGCIAKMASAFFRNVEHHSDLSATRRVMCLSSGMGEHVGAGFNILPMGT